MIHAANRDIPVKILDLSSTGALFSLDMLAPDAGVIDNNERLQLSLQSQQSVFQVAARVVRTTQGFVAVEFVADSEASRNIDDKLKCLSQSVD